MIASLRDRLPAGREMIAVYGLAAIVIHGWTLFGYFYKLPSWYFFMTLGDLLSALAYVMFNCLLECLVIMAALLLASLVLPKKWFRDAFLVTSSSLVLLGLSYMIYIALNLPQNSDTYPAGMVRLIPLISLLILAAGFMPARVPQLRKVIEGLAERAGIFFYIFMPVGLISLGVVLVRNL
jgi:hypothetical protein